MKHHHIFSRLLCRDFQDKEEIFCMARVIPRQTNLSIRLYLDDNGTFKGGGHWKRIKFQHDKDIPDARDWCPMDFEGNVRNEKHKYKIKISQREINEISNFVKNNVYALNALCDVQDFIIDDFLKVMIPGGEPATPEQVEEQKRKTDKIISEIGEQQ